ncbi:MAG: ATP-binding protein [Desulfobulbaceae bacterium]|nr:ATP-binding protein [Desulfobulbaceae bacterium]
MTASPSSDMMVQNTFVTSVKGLPRLLRSSVLYGPNAAGKSNLFRALHFMQEFVQNSAKEKQAGESIPLQPFLLNQDGPSSPSEFEAIFLQDDIRYQYGFTANTERVTHEWLFAYPQGKSQRWFERSYNPETRQEEWYFGSKFTGKKKVWQEATRPNALFLSAAIQLNNEQLKPVFFWFKHLAVIRHGDILDPGFSIKQCQDDENRQRIVDFMNAADLSIVDIELESRDFAAEELPSDMPLELKERIRKDLHGKKILRISFKHKTADGNFVSLPLEEESDGTRKLFAYAAPWLDALQNGRTFLVDELDNSLHPYMVRFLLQLINNSDTNKKNGQLIFSTHDTSILDQKLLRRDQIWFIEKDKFSSSRLYPLSDFSPRKGEALEKGYLQGRYGALPYIGEIHF